MHGARTTGVTQDRIRLKLDVEVTAPKKTHPKKKPRGLSAASGRGRDPEVNGNRVALKALGVQRLPIPPDGLSQFSE
jgi:hypothetical protein